MNKELVKELQGTVLDGVDKKELDYSVPADFFKHLSTNVIKESQFTTPKKREARFMNMNFMAIAASVAVLVGAFFIFQFQGRSSGSDDLFEYMEGQELIEYAALEMDIEDFELLDIEGITEDSHFSSLSVEEINSFLISETDLIEIEQLIEYL